MSPKLEKFLADWLTWAEAGAPPSVVFHRHHGLCVLSLSYGLLFELEQLLRQTTGTYLCPFDRPGLSYFVECQRGIAHRNPKRLAWVRQQLEKN